MSDEKQEKRVVHTEGQMAEQARCLEIVKRHAREFGSRDSEVDKRVAAALEEIAKEVQFGIEL